VTRRSYPPSDIDVAVRVEAFNWLHSQVAILGDVLPLDILRQGFTYEGARVPMMGPQGIFKPAVLPELPLSITTRAGWAIRRQLHFERPAQLPVPWHGPGSSRQRGAKIGDGATDAIGLLPWRREEPVSGCVAGLHRGDDPAHLAFLVAADDEQLADSAARNARDLRSEVHETEGRRAYITSTVRVRLHQRGFRERVLRAYREQCALCRLRHRDLLDAAHIIGDSESTASRW